MKVRRYRGFKIFIHLLEAESTPGPEVISKKNPSTLSGVGSATFRVVAQCIKQICHRVPQITSLVTKNIFP